LSKLVAHSKRIHIKHQHSAVSALLVGWLQNKGEMAGVGLIAQLCIVNCLF